MAFLERILGRRGAPPQAPPPQAPATAKPRPRRAPPFQPDADDVFLVAYPRSGSTWVRAVAAAAQFGRPARSLEELDRLCPDVHARTPAGDVAGAERHLVKSHWPRCPRDGAAAYRRVIYLLRDPRDVVLSHVRYLTQLGRHAGDFDAFLADWLCGRVYPCSWGEHVVSWLGPPGPGPDCDLLRVRYEDLLARPGEQFARLLSFLGTAAGDRLGEILADTSPEQMRRKEAAGMRAELRVAGLEFIGAARAGRWREALTDAQAGAIAAAFARPMELAGYA